jgi:orotidine-5'-phosphate decarboxylase
MLRALQTLLAGPAVYRIIIPLDMKTAKEAAALVDEMMACGIRFFKIGFELISGGAADEVSEYIRRKVGFVFWDQKLHDIPNTVAEAAAALYPKCKMLNVHAQGGRKMMEATVKRLDAVADSGVAFAERPAVIAVTVLTSLNADNLIETGAIWLKPEAQDYLKQKCLEVYVLKLARLAMSSGLDGVVCSAHEVAAIREACGPDFLTVVPGIHFADGPVHDQKRVATPYTAIKDGADFLVMGRAITEAKDRQAAVARAIAEIEEGLAARAAA